MSDSLAALTACSEGPVEAIEERRVGQYMANESGTFFMKREGDTEVAVQLANFSAEIVADVAKDDGEQTTREYGIEIRLGKRTSHIKIPAREFASFAWTAERCGPRHIVNAGQATRDRLREASQRLSNRVVESKVFVYTGWRKIGGSAIYLCANGAIGADGLIADAVELPERLRHFQLPEPPVGDARVDAIHASLRLLSLAPYRITAPAFCAVWRSVLGVPVDFLLWIAGRSGTFKTELLALIQRHFGMGFDSRHLPAAWDSTANSLLVLGFALKDAVIGVDNFVPSASTYERSRQFRDLARVVLAVGDQSGRSRLDSRASLQTEKHPRGLVIGTGEDDISGYSAQGRAFTIEIAKGEIEASRLTACQHDAANGLYAQAMSAVLQWLASRLDGVHAAMRSRYEDLRAEFAGSCEGAHERTPGILADLFIGAETFLRCAVDFGAITAAEADTYQKNIRAGLLTAIVTQRGRLAEQDPVARFLWLLASAISSGAAHVAQRNGNRPDNCRAWGWRSDWRDGLDRWEPRGMRVGWLDGADLYLDPEASFKAAQGAASDGAAIAVSLSTLRRRLSEAHKLKSTGAAIGRETLTIRKNIEGRRLEVLHLAADAIAADDEVEIEVTANG